ncbi:zinc finger protein 774-like [Venturia canescens]|uniref:zinc finger protein 774-like n=1 Tax=Venturia canescens TaxID=32260 RepID=UPI001C9C4D55|nr:zinc finger protein 774-like [Venturia canescens]XP_043285377.1 zinc finger protein 774-like [Venturia canescens]XP_043285378.1 zinc finger protein 774-like [Venturia canescens]
MLKYEMNAATSVTNQWIPPRIYLEPELPIMPDVPFVSPKEENYYAKSLKHKHSKMEEISERRYSAKISLEDEKTETPVNQVSLSHPPVRINHRAQIDVIDIEEGETSDRKRVLIYEEQQTKLVILKALESGEVREVANQLVEIVTMIGAPRIIQSGQGRDYAEQVVREIRLLLRDFCVVHGDTSKKTEERRNFRFILNTWMKNHPGRTLNEALRIVQVIENTTTNSRHGTIPSQLFFGRNTCEDLRRTIGIKGPQENSCQKTNSQLKEQNVLDYGTEKSITEIRNKKSSEPNLDLTTFGNVVDNVNISLIAQENTNDFSKKKDLGEANNFFKCVICHKNYTKLGHLRNHMKTHDQRTSNFDCTICHQSFRSSSVYNIHMKNFHEQKLTKNEDEEQHYRLESNAKNENSKSRVKKIGLISEESKERIKNKTNRKRVALRNLAKKPRKKIEPRKKGIKSERTNKLNDNSLLECKFCKQTFNFPSVLQRHVRSHTNERPYVCEICNKSFKQLGHLSQHSLTHTDYRSFRCTTCSIKFDSLEALKLHTNSHKEETMCRSKKVYRLFECDICKKVFTTKSILERHIFTHTHERKFACKICGRRFKQAGHVKSHMLVHTGERNFECDICTKRFSLSNSLKKHMYVHNGDKPYQCDICGSRFLEKRNLNGHLMTHTNEKPFSCKICGKRYTLADTLRRHVSAAHEDGRTYQCEICAKMFKQLAHLSVHKKVHNDERPFQCHLCEKNFKHKNVLKSHLAIHANVRPFECDACKATFVRKTNLQTHITSAHMNERPYACTICNKRFKQISHLNGHIVVHSNSMPYQCDFCDRRCNRLDNLKKHMRLHTKNVT